MDIGDQATFKGAVKFGIRHVPTGKWYNSARYANGFCGTPSLKNDLWSLQNMVDAWCNGSEKDFYEEHFKVKMNTKDFAFVEFTLTVTAIVSK